jgi:hypothetical protein
MREIASPVPNCRAWRTDNNLAVICGREPCGPQGALRWHLSVSHAKRYPTWEEIRDLRYLLIPDEVMVAMFLPPRSQYVDVHHYCFHLYEVEASDQPVALVSPSVR